MDWYKPLPGKSVRYLVHCYSTLRECLHKTEGVENIECFGKNRPAHRMSTVMKNTKIPPKQDSCKLASIDMAEYSDFLQSNKTLINTESFCFSVLYTKEYAIVCGLIKFWPCGFVAFLFVLTELGFLLFLFCGMQCALIMGHILTVPQNHCCSSWWMWF